MLRKLMEKDAPLMLEWMHDEDVIRYMKTDFMSFSMDNCLNFIRSSERDPDNVHLAIVDENDEYQGTASLKHINNGTAEFAITIRKSAMGKGISSQAMKDILEYGKQEMKLDYIYWCVSPENVRATHFYRKNGYKEVNVRELSVYETLTDYYEKQEVEEFLWFVYK